MNYVSKKPLDYKDIAENLRKPEWHDIEDSNDLLIDGAQAIEELTDFADELAEQVCELQIALAKMWFAYQNKDAEMPHDFELEAVEKARELLGEWSECMPKYLRESITGE